MRSKSFIPLIAILLAVLVLALPVSSVAARKVVFKANLLTTNELHQVVGSNARGSAILSLNPDGSVIFGIIVRNLSGPATGVHLHGPADSTQNAPILIGLCGNPAPAVVGACTYDTDGNLVINGTIGAAELSAWGVTGGQFMNYLRNGLLYVNVHTALNPAGEVRGQLIEQ